MLKGERLSEGNTGDPKAPNSYYVGGISLQVFTTNTNVITLVGKKNSSTILTIKIYRQTRTFHALRASDVSLEINHIYAIERLFQSYALTLNFPVTQILFPLYGSIGLKSEVEFAGNLENFPPLGA
jgi:hypothetical protein